MLETDHRADNAGVLPDAWARSFKARRAVAWKREWYYFFRREKLEHADLLRKDVGGEPIVAAVAVGITGSQVSAICVRIELRAIARVFDRGLHT
jgi:hypothetical protein